jgi:hypothetical protein
LSAFEHNLKPRQVKAIEALMTEPNVKAAAQKAGVGFATLRRWLDDPTFCAALREARNKAFERILSGLSAAAETAVQVLRDLLDNAKEESHVRLRSAKTSLDSFFKSYSLIEIEGRLASIEAQLKAIENERQRSTWEN